jgi:hypothetical protein
MSVYSLVGSDRDIFNLTPPTAITDVITRDDYNSTIVGDQAGRETIGELNSFFGYRAGASNRSGFRNVFIGAFSGEKNARGDNNVIIGTEAGRYIATGRGNVLIGNKSGFSNNGNFNVYIGYLNTTQSLDTSFCNLTMGYDANTNGNNNICVGNKLSISSTNSIILGNTTINTGNNNIVIGGSIRNQASNVLIINNRHNSNINSNVIANYSNDYMNINDYIVAYTSNNINTLTLTNDVVEIRSSNMALYVSAGILFQTQNGRLSLESNIILETFGNYATRLMLSSNVYLGSSNTANIHISSSNAILSINSNNITMCNDWGKFAINSNTISIGSPSSNMSLVLQGSNNIMTLCNGEAYFDSRLQIVRNAIFRSNIFFNSNTIIKHDGNIALSNDYVYRIGGIGETHFTQNVCFSNSFPNGVMTFSNVPQGYKNWENVSDSERQEFYGSTIIQKNLYVGGMVYSSGINSGNRLILSSGENSWNQYVTITSNLNPYLVFESSTGSILRFGDDFQPEQLNFTGKHRCVMNNLQQVKNEMLVGRIVYATGDYMNLDSKNDISIDESIPIIELCEQHKDKRVFGVISSIEEPSEQRSYRLGNLEMLLKKNEDDIRVIVNSVGEGGIWVCNINGCLKNGDLITSSQVPGFGMKQDDDIIHSYTVAKITCDCDFDSQITYCKWRPTTIEFTHVNVTYKVAFVGCVYKF